MSLDDAPHGGQSDPVSWKFGRRMQSLERTEQAIR
jgi:hypothetical protein